jgi:ribosomal protein S18 acetylase RimI-like enzyme
MSLETETFTISVAPEVGDDELASLLHTVYVDGGHTPALVAETLLAPVHVRQRGTLLTAEDKGSGSLLGMIVVVPPGGDARQVARHGEAEFHLLGVHPGARGQGIGRALVRRAIKFAKSEGWSQIVLSTQRQMTSAQSVYATAGFARVPERDWTRSDRQFLVYSIDLSAKRADASR